MSTVLVTGASGFIGRQCLPLLVEAGFAVEAVSSRAAAGAGPAAVRWHQADLLDAAQVRVLIQRLRPTHLLHLAWYAVPGKYWTAAENTSWLHAGRELLRTFAASGGRRAVAAGTCAEYDWNYGICSEVDTPLAPATPYGAAKHALQQELAALAAPRGFSSAWGRIFLVYGPHEHPDRLVPSIIRAMLAGAPARCTYGNQQRDFLHVTDVAGAFVSLLASQVTGPINIASGRPVAVREVVGRIGAKLGTPELIRFGALLPREGEPPLLAADVRRLVDELRWRPRFDLDRGLDHTIAWWKSEAASRVEQS